MSTERSEDEAWRAIVDNYGERALLDDEPLPDPGPPSPEPAATPVGGPLPAAGEQDEAAAWEDEPEEPFVPPVPPPAPRLPLPKRLAWLAVLGTPVVLLVVLVTSVYVPPVLGYGLVAAFVGSFGYLVATMERAGQRDPWDDGAQI